MRTNHNWNSTIKRNFGRALSVLLSVLLAAEPACINTFAAQTGTGTLPKSTVPEYRLEASRIGDEGIEEGKYLYFGTFSTDLDESESIYSFPIYREGDLSEEASVTVLAVDISAKYGTDYELLPDEGTEIFVSDEDSLPLMQRKAAESRLTDSVAAQNSVDALIEAAKEETEKEEQEKQETGAAGTADVTGLSDKGNAEALPDGSKSLTGSSEALADSAKVQTDGAEAQTEGAEAQPDGANASANVDTAQPDSGKSQEKDAAVDTSAEVGTTVSSDQAVSAENGTEEGLTDEKESGSDNRENTEGSGQDAAAESEPEIDEAIGGKSSQEGEPQEMQAPAAPEEASATEEKEPDAGETADTEPNQAGSDGGQAVFYSGAFFYNGGLEADTPDSLEAASGESEGSVSSSTDAEAVPEQSESISVNAEVVAEGVEETAADAEGAADTTGTAGSHTDGTGENTAGTDSSESGGSSSVFSLKDNINEGAKAIAGSTIAAEVMNPESVDFSAAMRIHFEAGETEKLLRFRVHEDGDEEGPEMFSLMLTEPEGAEVYKTSAFTAVIRDNEEESVSLLSFASPKYYSEDGRVTVTVKRTGAVYKLATATLITVGDTAKAGTNYSEKNETIAFQPYETEKEITLDVYGRGQFELVLKDFKGCEGGRSERTTLMINEEERRLRLFAASNSANDGDQSFSINVGGKDYEVHYSTDDDLVGTIYDTNFSPALKVGDYYFANNFSYGTSGDYLDGSDASHNEAGYDSGGSKHDKHGYIQYWNFVSWETGSLRAKAPDLVPVVHYQYIVPDWASDAWAGGGGRFFEFKLASSGWDLTKSKNGFTTFDRKVDTDGAKVVPEVAHNIGKMGVYPRSGDESSWLCPKSRMHFYGAVAMYKEFEVSVGQYQKLKYRTAGGGTLESEPFRTQVKSGARILSDGGTLSIRTGREKRETNLVFGTSDISLNGHSGKFGEITGYTLDIDPVLENYKTVNYPEDYKNWLRSKKGAAAPAGVKQYIDYSSEAVEKQIAEAEANLDTIPYNEYFVDWIESVAGKATLTKSVGYVRKLRFTPQYAYTDIKVTVVKPSYGEASFNSADLSLGTHSFHAGDELDMSATPGANYWLDGYEVSTDGGATYDLMRSTDSLFLVRGKEYMVRPVVSRLNNRIEIRFADNTARDVLQVNGLIADAVTAEVPAMKGKYFLELNPEAAGAVDKALPVTGRDYSFGVIVKENVTPPPMSINTYKNGKWVRLEWEYRPYVIDGMTGKKYNASFFPLIARSQAADNVYTVGVDLVEKDEVQTYSISSRVYSKSVPVRDNAMSIKKVPVTGYTVSAGTGRVSVQDSSGRSMLAPDTKNAVTDMNGGFKLSGITACEGDVIPLLIGNGTGAGQIAELRIGSGKQDQTLNSVEIGYPYDSPRVTSVMYSYDNPMHNQQEDLNQNTINIYDDTINLTFVIDKKGRELSKVAVTIVNPNGTTVDYEAVSENKDNIYSVAIKKMNENLFNGDRVYVHLVDAEKTKASTNKGTKSVDIVYPTIDTGLLFYVQNQPVVPQYYELSQDTKPEVDIPVMGTTSALSTGNSGQLSVSKLPWKSGKGYTLTINIGAGLDSTTAAAKLARWDKFKSAVKNEADARKSKKKIDPDEVGSSLAGDGDSEGGDKADIHSSGIIDSLIREDTMDDMGGNRDEQIKTFNEDVKTAGKTDAKNTMASMSTTTWSVQGIIMFGLQYVYSETRKDYIYTSGSFAFGVMGTVEYSKYMMFGVVPGYVFIEGTAQLDFVYDYVLEEGKKALTAGEFNSYSGNIAQILGGDDSASMVLLLKGSVGIGVGAKGILGAGGYVELLLQILCRLKGKGDPGFLISAGGGIYIDLLITSINIKIVQYTQGFGAYEGKSGFDFFGGLLSTRNKRLYANAAGGTDREETILHELPNGEVHTEMRYHLGSGDLSSFGQERRPLLRSFGASRYARESVLFDEAADRTRPVIARLSDGSLFAAFLGSRGGEDPDNDEVLYYALWNEAEGWAKASPVYEDSTNDTLPALRVITRTDEAGKRTEEVLIAWSSAESKVNGEDTVEQLGRYRVCVSRYDVAADKMSEPVFVGGSAPAAATLTGRAVTDPAEEAFIVSAVTANQYASDPAAAEQQLEKARTEAETAVRKAARVATPSNMPREDEEDTDTARSTVPVATPSNMPREDEADAVRSKYMELAPETVYLDDGRLFCVYTEYDLSTIEDVGEFIEGKSPDIKLRYAVVDTDSMKVLQNKEFSDLGENAYVKDFALEKVHLEENTADGLLTGGDYVLVAYSAGENGKLTDEGNMQMYLSILVSTEENGKESFLLCPPLQITKYGEHTTAPQLFKAGDGVYLSYLKNDDAIELIDLAPYLRAMFQTNKAPQFLADARKGKTDWYRKTAEELGMELISKNPEGGKPLADYEGSLYEQLHQQKLAVFETPKIMDSINRTDIHEFRVVSDGTHAYLLFVERVWGESGDVQSVKELFGMRLKRYDEKRSSAQEEGGNGKDTSYERAWHTSAPVQLTETGRVVGDIEAFYDPASDQITVIADSRNETVDKATGNVDPGQNRLVLFTMDTKSFLEIENDYVSCEADPDNVGETGVKLRYTVRNTGLDDALGGYRTWITAENGEILYDCEEKADKKNPSSILGIMERRDHTVRIPVSKAAPGSKLTVHVQNHANEANSYQAVVSVPEFSGYRFSEGEVYRVFNEYMARALVSNPGTVRKEAGTAYLVLIDKDGKIAKSYADVQVPALEPGESRELEFAFVPELADFSEFNTLELAMTGDSSALSKDELFMTYVASGPELLSINDGDEAVSITGKNSVQLKVSAAPYEELLNGAYFSSSDNSVAEVSPEGVVTAVGNGSAVIRVYYPAYGIEEDITVNVSGIEDEESEEPVDPDKPDDPVTPSGGSGESGGGNARRNTGSPYLTAGGPEYQLASPVSGNWVRLADGGWAFVYSTNAPGAAADGGALAVGAVSGYYTGASGLVYIPSPLLFSKLGTALGLSAADPGAYGVYPGKDTAPGAAGSTLPDAAAGMPRIVSEKPLSGAFASGWQYIAYGENYAWYHFDSSGRMDTGWNQAPGGNWYYLNESGPEEGTLRTGWFRDPADGSWYHLKTGGVLLGSVEYGWFVDSADGNWYYLDPLNGGRMVVGRLLIDGREELFDASGRWIPYEKR